MSDLWKTGLVYSTVCRRRRPAPLLQEGTAAGEIVSPATDETYVFLRQTKEGSCMYKEKSAYLKSREEWLCKNGKKDYHKPNRQGGNTDPAATDSVKAGFHQAQPAQIEQEP